MFVCSYMESDPVKIVVERVETFKKENCNLIIVDTSGISPSLYLINYTVYNH